jgi:hypothetical protein
VMTRFRISSKVGNPSTRTSSRFVGAIRAAAHRTMPWSQENGPVIGNIQTRSRPATSRKSAYCAAGEVSSAPLPTHRFAQRPAPDALPRQPARPAAPTLATLDRMRLPGPMLLRSARLPTSGDYAFEPKLGTASARSFRGTVTSW